MSDTGAVTLTSGNRFRWTHVRANGRGGINGEFLNSPTEGDITEAREVSRSLIPEGGREAFNRIIADNRADSVLADFLAHNARNN